MRSRQYTTMHCGFGPLYTYYQFAGAARSVFVGCRCKHISENLSFYKMAHIFRSWYGIKASLLEAVKHLIWFMLVASSQRVEQCRKINVSFSWEAIISHAISLSTVNGEVNEVKVAQMFTEWCILVVFLRWAFHSRRLYWRYRYSSELNL
jgi:hypothetical protein